jgi:hypothetical protein
VIINHPGHYMKISKLELPQHLYTQTTADCGAAGELINPEELVSWAEQGRGDAIFSLCHTVYERNLASIDAWERDELMSASKYAKVKHYHTTLEDVAREAEMKRANAKERMVKHQAAIEQLVEDAREFISAFVVQQDEGDMLTYLLVIAAVVATGYMFFY